MIRRDIPGLSLSRQCQVLAISRSSFYYTPKGESAENLSLMRRIDELFLKYPFYGSRQMARQLRREGLCIGRHRVRRLMRLMGLEAIYQAPRTSDPHPAHRIYPYLLKRMKIDHPNHVWCADITYHPGSSTGSCTWSRSWTGQPPCFGMAAVEHHGCFLLRRGPERGAVQIRQTGNLQHRSGKPVHQLRLHRRSQGSGDHDLHGWPGSG